MRVRSPNADALVERLRQAGAMVRPAPEGEFEVVGMDSAAIGELAAANGLVLHQLATQRASLEEAFMELTHDSVEYHAAERGISDRRQLNCGGRGTVLRTAFVRRCASF